MMGSPQLDDLPAHTGDVRGRGAGVDQPRIQVVTGEDARRLLRDESFVRRWEVLARACAWRTPFLEPAYVRTWYDCYAETAAPVLVHAQGRDGTLVGLLPLTSVDGGEVLTGAGAHQAEYQGWLAVPGATAFVGDALDALRDRTSARRLTLRYLPSGTPVEALRAHPTWGRAADVLPFSRALMRADADDAAKSLKKSANRSKLARLGRVGPVRLERLTDRPALEAVIDEIADFCDLRQGAVNGVLPFRADPRKREFHLRMLEQPGLLHATVLRAGDQLAAVHLGVAAEREVQLGVIAHSPFLAAHSPGKLLLLFLARALADEGFTFLDLTPGGSYKERFATEHDTVHVAEVYLRASAAVEARARARVRATVRAGVIRAASALGTDAASLRRRVATAAGRLRPMPQLPKRLVRGVRDRVSSRSDCLFYRMSAEQARALPAQDVAFRRDSVSDVLCYAPATPDDRPRQQFLSDALDRLENGRHVYTLVERGVLVHFAWLIEEQAVSGSEYGQPYELAPRSCVLYDDYTHPTARGRGLHKASLVARARDAATTLPVDWIYISVLAENTPSRRNIERVGFVRCAQFTKVTRLGRTTLS